MLSISSPKVAGRFEAADRNLQICILFIGTAIPCLVSGPAGPVASDSFSRFLQKPRKMRATAGNTESGAPCYDRQDNSDRHQQFLRAFTTNEPALRAYIRRLVPSRTDADDVLQEVAIVLWEKFGEFREGGDFRAWACGIARFKAMSWLRDKRRDRLVLDEDVAGLVANDASKKEDQLAAQRSALETCFEKVPENERQLLTQAYQPATKIQDVAASSGRSVGGFYQWLHRMRLMLLDCIQRQHQSAGELP